jgi:hypothetical protein
MGFVFATPAAWSAAEGGREKAAKLRYFFSGKLYEF